MSPVRKAGREGAALAAWRAARVPGDAPLRGPSAAALPWPGPRARGSTGVPATGSSLEQFPATLRRAGDLQREKSL